MTRWLRNFIAYALLLLLGFPAVASANAGTVLITASRAHLLGGNAFIGIVEGLLLARFFKARRLPAIALMVLANYFSAWVGFMLAGERLTEPMTRVNWYASPLDVFANIYTARLFIWIGVLALYLLTVLLEWPFVAGALWGQKSLRRRSLLASAVVQAVSYALLIGWYARPSTTTMLSATDRVSVEQFGLKSDFCLYTIGARDGDVYRMESPTARREKVFDLNSRQEHDRLFAVAGDDARTYEVFGGVQRPGTDSRPVRIEEQDAVDAVPLQERSAVREGWSGTRATLSGRKTMQFASASASDWKFSRGSSPAVGLVCRDSDSPKMFALSLETPVLAWAVWEVLALPGDQVMFRLGRDQICVFDPESSKLALIARGRSPLVLLRPLPPRTAGTD